MKTQSETIVWKISFLFDVVSRSTKSELIVKSTNRSVGLMDVDFSSRRFTSIALEGAKILHSTCYILVGIIQTWPTIISLEKNLLRVKRRLSKLNLFISQSLLAKNLVWFNDVKFHENLICDIQFVEKCSIIGVWIIFVEKNHFGDPIDI